MLESTFRTEHQPDDVKIDYLALKVVGDGDPEAFLAAKKKVMTDRL